MSENTRLKYFRQGCQSNPEGPTQKLRPESRKGGSLSNSWGGMLQAGGIASLTGFRRKEGSISSHYEGQCAWSRISELRAAEDRMREVYRCHVSWAMGKSVDLFTVQGENQSAFSIGNDTFSFICLTDSASLCLDNKSQRTRKEAGVWLGDLCTSLVQVRDDEVGWAEEGGRREYILSAGQRLSQQGLLVLWVMDTRQEEDSDNTQVSLKQPS